MNCPRLGLVAGGGREGERERGGKVGRGLFKPISAVSSQLCQRTVIVLSNTCMQYSDVTL